jgi:MotA/TolQ/ExbB proton channel family protein
VKGLAVDTSPSVQVRPSVLFAPPSESRDFLPLLRWLILMSLTGFGIAVLWQLGLVQVMFATDRTRLSSLILALFMLTTLHCLTQTWGASKELTAVRVFREALIRRGRFSASLAIPTGVPEDSLIARHVANLVAKSRAQRGKHVDQTLLLRTLADRLRGREKLGIFVSEGLLRLALLGTAIGFILMLIPIAGLNAFDAETLRKALAGMSGGMATALNVTVTGISTALLLKLQYFFLDKALVQLFDSITEVTEVHVISALEHGDDV